MSVLLASRGCPFTSVASESCELKNCECSRCGRVAPGTVTSRLWKLRLKVVGMSVTIFDSSTRPVSVRAVRRTGDSATLRAVGLQGLRLVSDVDRLVQLSDLQLHVHANRRVDVHLDALTYDL